MKVNLVFFTTGLYKLYLELAFLNVFVLRYFTQNDRTVIIMD